MTARGAAALTSITRSAQAASRPRLPGGSPLGPPPPGPVPAASFAAAPGTAAPTQPEVPISPMQESPSRSLLTYFASAAAGQEGQEGQGAEGGQAAPPAQNAVTGDGWF